MRPAAVKLLIGGTVILLATAYLGLSGAQTGWVYYVDVDQYLADSTVAGRRARVFGVVGEQDLELNRVGLSARFDLLGSARRLRVSYTGAVPELFQAGRQVVVEGRVDEGGTFRADVLLTKCSSKYEGHSPALREARAAEPPR